MPYCEHNFKYAGLRFCNGNRSLPGSSATRRYYAHVYFCEKCLLTRAEPGMVIGNSYDKIREGATPGTAEQCGVPMEDL
jgi:hypothetical protein